MEIQRCVYLPQKLNGVFITVITANINVQKDVWFVGDSFIKDNFSAFQAMRKQAKRVGQVGPYILEHYNASPLTTARTSQVHSPLARIHSALVNEINACKKLLRMIIIIPDQDIVKSVDFYKFGITMIFDKVLKWLVNEINKVVSTKKDELEKRRAGSIVASEPKIVYMTMLF